MTGVRVLLAGWSVFVVVLVFSAFKLIEWAGQ